MVFKFNNYSRHVGTRGEHHWYQWQVFMDEPPEKLAMVKSVEYHLHETFPNPIQVVDDQVSRFALTSAGWGQFEIFIIVYLNDGSEQNSRYYLNLGNPWP